MTFEVNDKLKILLEHVRTLEEKEQSYIVEYLGDEFKDILRKLLKNEFCYNGNEYKRRKL